MPEYGDFVEARGGTKDKRRDDAEPYSAASYGAQYGIPMEDAEELIAKCANHGEIKAQIYKNYISEPEFREASLNHVTRPFKREWSLSEKNAHNIANTTEKTAQKIKENLGRQQVKDFTGDMGL